MRILHTSDWHLGQEFYGFRRDYEYEHFFRQLVDIVKCYQPDVMVVSGDIFHTPAPSATARKQYVEAVLQVHEAYPEMRIVITAGNHDSAARLEVDSRLWLFFNVHVIGNLRRDAQTVDCQEHIILVPGKGYVVPVPHVYPHNIPLAPEDDDKMKALFKLLLEETEKQNTHHLPVVLMAHLAVSGCDITGHQNFNDGVGGMEYVSSNAFDGHYDYVALGHIHRQQNVPNNNDKIRYSGTPLAVHFDEDYEHAVSVVDVEYGQMPKVTSIPISPLRPLVTLPDEPVDFDEAIKILESFDPGKEAYIRLYVNLNDGLPPYCAEKAAKAVNGKKCRFCTFKRFDNMPRTQNQQLEDISPDQLKMLTPADVAKKYMEGKGFSDETIAEFASMMAEVMKNFNNIP